MQSIAATRSDIKIIFKKSWQDLFALIYGQNMCPVEKYYKTRYWFPLVLEYLVQYIQ